MAASLVFVVAVSVADWLVGPNVSLVIFYVLPVIAATWLGRIRTGVILAVLVTVVGGSIAAADPGTATDVVWLWNAAIPFAFYLLVVWLVAGQRTLLEIESRRATTDPLTGALTRRAFYEQADIDLDRARREHRPVAFIYLDVDGLKVVNDTIGHAAGDELLVRFAVVTRSAKRSSDQFGRLGGDEFALLLVGADLTEATAVAERVLDRLRHAPGLESSASVGVVACPKTPGQLDGLVRLADQLMYLAKRSGGSVVRAIEYDPQPAIDLRPAGDRARPAADRHQPAAGRHQPGGDSSTAST